MFGLRLKRRPYLNTHVLPFFPPLFVSVSLVYVFPDSSLGISGSKLEILYFLEISAKCTWVFEDDFPPGFSLT